MLNTMKGHLFFEVKLISKKTKKVIKHKSLNTIVTNNKSVSWPATGTKNIYVIAILFI